MYAANKKPPVLIPREISGMTTRYDNQVFLILLKNSSFENEFMGDRVIWVCKPYVCKIICVFILDMIHEIGFVKWYESYYHCISLFVDWQIAQL